MIVDLIDRELDAAIAEMFSCRHDTEGCACQKRFQSAIARFEFAHPEQKHEPFNEADYKEAREEGLFS